MSHGRGALVCLSGSPEKRAVEVVGHFITSLGTTIRLHRRRLFHLRQEATHGHAIGLRSRVDHRSVFCFERLSARWRWNHFSGASVLFEDVKGTNEILAETGRAGI